jgi:lia operon protein LiaF
VKERRVFGGLFLILLGTVFLLNNLGLISWDIWWAFLEFWPLLLIAIGFRLIFRHNPWLQAVVFLVLVAIPLVYYYWYGGGYFPRWI